MNKEKIDKTQWKPTQKECIMYSILGILFIGQIVLCILFYNSAGLYVLAYTGFALLPVGFFVFGGMARGSFQKKGGAKDEKDWLKTKVVVDSGIYAVVRHPIYVSFMFYVVGLMLISQHWLSVIFGIPIIVFFYQCMLKEERDDIEKFGDKYKRYMKNVPRANFLLGIIRLAQHKKRNENDR